MDVKEGRNDSLQQAAFQRYQGRLDWINRRMDPGVLEFYGERIEDWKHAKEVAFLLYQDFRCLFGFIPSLDECLNREKKAGIPPYKFEGNDTEFPCEGVLEYRDMEFPVYYDDYGMSLFAVVNGVSVQIDSLGGETDWYYEFDKILDRIY